MFATFQMRICRGVLHRAPHRKVIRHRTLLHVAPHCSVRSVLQPGDVLPLAFVISEMLSLVFALLAAVEVDALLPVLRTETLQARGVRGHASLDLISLCG